MANTSSAKKAARSALKKRASNERRKRAMRSGVKDLRKLAESGKDAAAKLPSVFQAIDKALKRGVIKRGTASRMKSKLSKLVAKK